jgi:SET domain-containing protein
MPVTYVSKSEVSGQGLFTKRDIEKGEIIIDNRPLKDTFYLLEWERLRPEQYNRNWLIPVDELYCLTSDEECELHYINHSRNPNCEWHIEELYITAKELIRKDKELFIDYRKEVRPNREKWPEWI